MIVLIDKGLESDSKRGTRTEITLAGKAAGPAQGRALFPGRLLGSPGGVFSCGRAEMELP